MTPTLRSCAILALTLLWATSASAQNYSAQGAGAFVQSRDYQGLLRYASAWTAAQPDSAEAWSYLGAVYGLYLKEPDKAVAPMQRSLQLNPNQAGGWHALGITFLALKQNADAVNAISRAIKLNPGQPNYYNNLAVAYTAMARWQDAFNALNDEKELALKLDNAVVWYNLGNGYSQLEQAAPSVDAYQHAVKLKPEWAEAWTNLGVMLQWGCNVPAAQQAYARGAQLGDPLGAQNGARLQKLLDDQAAAQAAAAANADMDRINRIINRQAKENLENQLHREGKLNLNEKLP